MSEPLGDINNRSSGDGLGNLGFDDFYKSEL
jgi:hypothetical protein